MKGIIVILVVLVIFNTLDYDAYACSCATQPVSVNIEQTPIIFAGTLLEKTETAGREYHYVFELEKLWKNDSSNILLELKNVTVITPSDGGLCGIEFDVGSEYLVYASNEGKKITTSLCSGSDLLSMKSNDILSLSESFADPDAEVTEPPSFDENGHFPPDATVDCMGRWHYNGTNCVQDKIIMVDQPSNDDAPFFGIFVYLDDLISWIFGK